MASFTGTVGRTDVIFVDLPFTTYELGRRFKSEWSFKGSLSPYELHLGFRYMVSALRDRGHTADIVYLGAASGAVTQRQLLRKISDIQPLILGFSSYEGSLKEAMRFVERMKARGIRSLICFGGHLATFSYSEILRDFHHLVDVIVLGEGEYTIIDLADAVKKNRSFHNIPGIAYFDADRVITTGPRPVERDINRFPFPAITTGWRDENIPLFLISSRGCYGHCSFCRTSLFGEKWRPRDPANVVDEIENAYRLGVTTFEMVDDNFLGPGALGKARATAIAAQLRSRGLRIQYHISCRVNDVDEATMRTLQDSGLISVSLGVESGVQRILDTFNKNVTVKQNISALQLLNRLGIPATVYIIFFDPYMTLDEARENLEFLKCIHTLYNVRFEPIIFRKLIPVSGTMLFNRLRSDGMLRGNYLSGHYFVFKDSRIGLLSDFMEIIDLRFERIAKLEQFQRVNGLYESFKTSFEFSVAGKAIDLLASGRWTRSEAQKQLEVLLSQELRSSFRSELSETATT